MSALRQAIAAIWAAVWVRWRLLAVRMRGLLVGGAPAATDRSGYYLSSAEIPAEGVDYELAELPPELVARLDTARAELVDEARRAAARRVRRRRTLRRRSASLATAALLTLGLLGAGATALVGGSTGVPAIDRLLGVYEAGLEKPGAGGRLGPSGRDLQPAPSGDSVSVEVGLAGGGRRAVSTSYVAKGAGICSALVTQPDRASGDVTCVSPARLRANLARGGGDVLAATTVSPGEVLVRGLVSGDATAVEGVGPTGRFDAVLGAPWDVDLLGETVRPFVAIASRDPERPVDPGDYALEAIAGNGERRHFWPR